MISQLINDEKFTNIQKAQAGLTRLFLDARKSLSFYRVMRNDESLGVLVPDNLWMNITEDIEALSSPHYRKKIEESRKSPRRYTASEIKTILHIT